VTGDRKEAGEQGSRGAEDGIKLENKQIFVYGFLPHLTITLLFLIVNFIKNILQDK
jgi:hypothetical protein